MRDPADLYDDDPGITSWAGVSDAVAEMRAALAAAEARAERAEAQNARLEERVRCSCGGWRRKEHRTYCSAYIGPLEHRWQRTSFNETFGGLDHWCVCGGWFRQGGLAGHGDGSETAEPICPKADETWRGPRPLGDP